MRRKLLQTFFLMFLACCVEMPHEFGKKSLSDEMKRLGVDTVLIVNSQAIDEYPLWSSNSDFVASNIMGEWHKFSLTSIKLVAADWREQRIGILAGDSNGSLLTQVEQKDFRKKLKYGPREVTTISGDKIELRLKGFSTSLVITKSGESSEVLWVSDLENCHSLSLSPDEKYVAYLCELNGLFVMRLK